MKYFRKNWFITIFIASLFFPLYGGILDNGISLSGVTAKPEKVDATVTSINDGTFQAYLNSVWENEFPGEKFLLRIRNQILYAINTSPNSNVVIGKEGYLYEPSYILFEIQSYEPSSDEYFENLGNNLVTLEQLLSENDKELYVFITPSKAHFYKDYIPGRYMFLNNEESYDYTNYSKLLETLDKNNINYFDANNYIQQNLDSNTFDSPLFYKSGIHWSHVWGENSANEFLKYINSISKYHLSTAEVTEIDSNEPVTPDTDLYSSLNLLTDANEKWYDTKFEIVEEGIDHPNIFLRGGSFMGQSLNALIKSGVFGEDVHFENSYYFTNQYTYSETLSSFTAYDELDLDTLMGQSDILVLEVNEGAISTMSWGFIEYLLEHPEYVDRNY